MSACDKMNVCSASISAHPTAPPFQEALCSQVWQVCWAGCLRGTPRGFPIHPGYPWIWQHDAYFSIQRVTWKTRTLLQEGTGGVGRKDGRGFPSWSYCPEGGGRRVGVSTVLLQGPRSVDRKHDCPRQAPCLDGRLDHLRSQSQPGSELRH